MNTHPADPARAAPDDGSPAVDAAASTQSPFPPEWAFVLQLQAGTSFLPSCLGGRIEHVQTGQAGMFASLEEAGAFIQRVMSHLHGAPP